MSEKSKGEAKEERTLAPWRPFGESSPGFGMGRLMDELFRDWRIPSRGQACVPAMDVSENDKQYMITVELPGSRKDDVHVELQEGMLTIRGEKKSEREEKEDRRRYVERSYGAFSRSFTLPPDADAGHVEASFKEGILTIHIPKTAEAKPRTVAIKAG